MIIQVGDVLVSSDIITEKFCCDLEACKGRCCIEGDAGAPVTRAERRTLGRIYPQVKPLLSPKAQAVVEKQGVSYRDVEGEPVTSIVDGKDCVFTYYNKEHCCLCALEKLYREGKTSFCKPISCYLYPIRRSVIGGHDALNYHRWDICIDAVKKGHQLNLPVYQFLKNALIQIYGKEWFEELELVVSELKKQNYL